MSKPRKTDSRRPSKKKMKKMEERRKAEERMRQFREEEARYTHPTDNSKTAIEACRQRMREGKLCYCKEKCHCRECQTYHKENGGTPCSLDVRKEEGGCALGCSECPECNQCG